MTTPKIPKFKKLKTQTAPESELPKPSEDVLNLLSSLIEDDEFETKVFPVAKNNEVKRSKFLIGNSRFVHYVDGDDLDPQEFLLKQKEEWDKQPTPEDVLDGQSVDLVKISKTQKKKLVKSLSNEIEDIRDFIVSDMAPSQMALSNALDDAKHIIEESLGIRLSSNHKLVEAMVRDAVRLKIFGYIAEKLKLSKEEKKIITDKFFVTLVATKGS